MIETVIVDFTMLGPSLEALVGHVLSNVPNSLSSNWADSSAGAQSQPGVATALNASGENALPFVALSEVSEVRFRAKLAKVSNRSGGSTEKGTSPRPADQDQSAAL